MTGAIIRPLRPPPSPGPLETHAPPSGRQWPRLDPAALYGLPGDVVRTLEKETEADPAALLGTFLCMYGSTVGPGSGRAVADGAQHPPRLFVVIAGQTAKARKGTSWQRDRQVMQTTDPDFSSRVVSGMASGEGLVEEAADRADKRILVYESEFARTLNVAARDGSTLSAILRQAWDGDTLRVMTRGNRLVAEGAHISVLAHITTEELKAKLTGLEAANGFANRFLFVCARRSRLLPDGGNLDDSDLHWLADRLRPTLDKAKTTGVMRRTGAAEELWRHIYSQAAQDDPGGLLGGLVARADGQLLRLSVTYALADGATLVDLDHLEAAVAFWRYCRESAEYIFGNSLGNPDAERVLAVVRAAEAGMLPKRALAEQLGKSIWGSRLDRALDVLEDKGLIIRTPGSPTGGRPRTLIVAIDG